MWWWFVVVFVAVAKAQSFFVLAPDFDDVTFHQKMGGECISDHLEAFVSLDQTLSSCLINTDTVTNLTSTCFRIGWVLNEHEGFDRFFSDCGATNSSHEAGDLVHPLYVLDCAAGLFHKLGYSSVSQNVQPPMIQDDGSIYIDLEPSVQTKVRRSGETYTMRDCFVVRDRVFIWIGLILGFAAGLIFTYGILMAVVSVLTYDDRVRPSEMPRRRHKLSAV